MATDTGKDMNNFAFNAPQFFDFSASENEEVKRSLEAYFEIDHEGLEIIPNSSSSESEKNISKFSVSDDNGDEFYSPMKQSLGFMKKNGLRKSLSVGNLPHEYQMAFQEATNLSSDMDNLSIKSNDIPDRLRGNTRRTEHLNRLAQPKYKFTSTENLSKAGEFVSMAEMVDKYQKGTPIRFRSRSQKMPQVIQRPINLQHTIPQSPMLKTKNRARPMHIMTQEQREKLELEEAKKFKIRAHPVNKKILQGPIKPTVVPKRPITVPEPFKMTTYPKKGASTPDKIAEYHFHAKPIPKGVLEPPKPLQKTSQPTIPQTPTFMRRITKESPKNKDNQNDKPKKSTPLTRTKPEPFSFEKRDQQILKRREQLINKVLEEEKKQREFHANPVPKAVLQGRGRICSQSGAIALSQGSVSGSSMKSAKSDENLNTVQQFKARPPKVLYMEPFQPKKEERPLIEITEFQLNTDRRQKEREEFQQKQREKEEMIAALKRQEEEHRRQMEEEEVARLRKQIQFKAKPIIKYKEVKIVPSAKVTEPKSPQFATDRVKRDKENRIIQN